MSLGSDGIPDPRRLPAGKVLKKDMVNDLRLEKRGEKEFVNSCSQLTLFKSNFTFIVKNSPFIVKKSKNRAEISLSWGLF
jgi:hypothetical protein